LTDALASVAVLAGGAAIYWLGWTWVDPALTLIIAGYILYLSVGMLKRTSSILMEGKPKDFDIDELAKAVEATPGIAGIHHVHVWELNEDQLAMEAHVVIQDEAMSRYEEVRA